MSISGISSNNSMMYLNINQTRQNQFQQTEQSEVDFAAKPPPPPSSQTSDENQLLAQELGVKMAMQQQDNGFNASQLAEMAEEGSPMSELFSALSENFEQADTDGDGVIKREEAMAFAEENGIDVPPPPGGNQSQKVDAGFNQEQLLEMAEDDSELSALFSALAESFDEADTDGDGVIKREEAMAFAEANGIDVPAPPSSTDAGFDLEQLSEMAATDSELSALFSALADNFEEADSDGDGLINREEAMIYAKNNEISFSSPGDTLSVKA
jgi:Ca2+-binding EF-hand superfamily protein